MYLYTIQRVRQGWRAVSSRNLLTLESYSCIATLFQKRKRRTRKRSSRSFNGNWPWCSESRFQDVHISRCSPFLVHPSRSSPRLSAYTITFSGRSISVPILF